MRRRENKAKSQSLRGIVRSSKYEIPAGGHGPSYDLLVDGRVSRGFDKGDYMQSTRFGRVSLSLRDNLMVRSLQVPVPLPIAA